jgi:uncharacterized protein (DUF4415 family)
MTGDHDMKRSKRSRRRGKSTTRSRNNVDVRPATRPQEGSPATVTWIRAVDLVSAEPKQPISFRVDPDVLEFFKERGRGYQTRMNAVLRAYMTAHGEE